MGGEIIITNNVEKQPEKLFVLRRKDEVLKNHNDTRRNTIDVNLYDLKRAKEALSNTDGLFNKLVVPNSTHLIDKFDSIEVSKGMNYNDASMPGNLLNTYFCTYQNYINLI